MPCSAEAHKMGATDLKVLAAGFIQWATDLRELAADFTRGGGRGSHRALRGRHAARAAPPIAGPSDGPPSGAQPVVIAPFAALSERPLLANKLFNLFRFRVCIYNVVVILNGWLELDKLARHIHSAGAAFLTADIASVAQSL